MAVQPHKVVAIPGFDGLVKIGSLGINNSCFYHSVIRVMSNLINSETKLKEYLQSVDGQGSDDYDQNVTLVINSFRKDCAKWMVTQSCTVPEAMAKIYSNPAVLLNLILENTQSLSDITTNPITETFKDQVGKSVIEIDMANYLLQLIESGNLDQAIDYLKSNCIWVKNVSQIKQVRGSVDQLKQVIRDQVVIDIDQFIKHFFTEGFVRSGTNIKIGSLAIFKEEIIRLCGDVKLGNLYIESVNLSLKIPTDSFSGMKPQQVRFRTKLWDQNDQLIFPKFEQLASVVDSYIKYRTTILIEIRTLIRAKDFKFGRHPTKYVNQKIASGQHIELILESINPKTGDFFTQSEVTQLFQNDPRPPNKECLDLPLNINFFTAGNGFILGRLETLMVSDGKDRTFEDFINRISGVNLSDAGEEDIIPFIPYILDIDLYIVRSTLKGLELINIYTTEYGIYSKQSVVINHIGNHFETIGLIEPNGNIKTLFEPDSPLISKIRSLK